MSNRQKADAIDLTKPSPQALSFILRHREFWPKNFRWDFRSSCTCAVGLAHAAWPVTKTEYITRALGADQRVGVAFVYGHYRPVPDWGVTPEMVADRIDQLVEQCK